MAEPIAVYVHIPFCPSKCGYCDFNSYAMDGDIVPATMAAIRREVLRSPWRGMPAKTIFFGGGTPTFPPVEQLLAVLEAVFEVHPPTTDCEITSEANPGTVDASKFAAMRQAGFNRVSIGAQSFERDELVRLDRVHSPGEIERAVVLARQAGFSNLNLDLMFALPHQSAAVWRSNLNRAIDLQPDHLSLYCLTLEPNTAFWKRHQRGELNLQSDEVQVTMSETTESVATAAGYHQYEISNYAKPGFECRHNLAYWTGEPYAGYGPGAVGCMDGHNVGIGERLGTVRYTNTKHPERYTDAVNHGSSIAFEWERLTPDIQDTERLMLGLRLNEGIAVNLASIDSRGLDTAISRGWLTLDEDRVRLTPLGRHFCSEVTVALMP